MHRGIPAPVTLARMDVQLLPYEVQTAELDHEQGGGLDKYCYPRVSGLRASVPCFDTQEEHQGSIHKLQLVDKVSYVNPNYTFR